MQIIYETKNMEVAVTLQNLRRCVVLAETLRDEIDELGLTWGEQDQLRSHNRDTVVALERLLSREEQKRMREFSNQYAL